MIPVGLKLCFFECQAYPTGFIEVVKNKLLEYAGSDDLFRWFAGNVKFRFLVILSHVEFLVSSGQNDVLGFLLSLRNLNPRALVLLSSANYTILTCKESYYSAGGVLFGSVLAAPIFDYEGVQRILTTNRVHFGFNYEKEDFKKMS